MTNVLATDNPYDDDQQRELRTILDAMIPAEGGLPGADDELIFADFISTSKPHCDVIYQVLELYAKSDIDTLSRSSAPSVRAFVSLVVQCYYRDDRVMAAIGMEPRPPHPGGYEVEQGDWSLLDPVRARGKIYREV